MNVQGNPGRKSGGWDGSTRRATLPADWPARVEAVKARAGGVCEQMKGNGRRCANPGRDVDHAVHRDDHEIDHLQLLCLWHHRAKTQREAAEAHWPQQAQARPAERHPGRLRR